MTQLTQEHVSAAAENIMSGVYAPVYLQKMAERGYRAETEEDARELLKIGFELAANGVTRQPAQTGRSKFAAASSALDQLLAGGPQDDYRYKAAAVELAQDPTIFQSAMVLKAAEQAVVEETKTKTQPATPGTTPAAS